MRKFNKKLTSLLLGAVTAVAMMVMPAFAAESSVSYDGDAKKFVFVPKNTDLFGNFKNVMPGDTLGAGAKRRTAEWTCEPMLAADAVWDAAIPKSRVLAAFRMLEEEESSLQVEAREGDGGIAIRVMGEIQLEVLREVLKSPVSGLLFTLREYPVVYSGSLIARVLGGAL